MCQIQVINEPNHEGTCNIKGLGIDTIHTFTKLVEDESETSSYDSDNSDRSSIYNNYSTSYYDYSVMNVEMLSVDPVIVTPRYVVQSGVVDDARCRSVGLGPLNTNMNFDNCVVTLPGLETPTQGSLLELNLSVRSYDDNTVNSLKHVHTLSLIHPKLIDCTLYNQPLNIPIFANDYTLACYLNVVERMDSSTSEQSEKMIEIDIKYLSRKN